MLDHLTIATSYYLTSRQVGEMLNRKRITVGQWRTRGIGPKFIRDEFGQILYTPGAIADFLEELQAAGVDLVEWGKAKPGDDWVGKLKAHRARAAEVSCG